MTGPVLSHLGVVKREEGGAEGAATEGHWRLGTDDDNIAWLVFDQRGASANTLSEGTLTELDRRLEQLDAEKPKALVIRSGKPSGFVAGADIGSFGEFGEPAAAVAMLQRGHQVLDRLEALDIPTIAVIHGYALGGGFELALACDYRIAIDGASFGFPEVMLGLHPGLGGTFRATELIDPVEAMTMMLTGKNAHTRKAKSLGIVDAVTEERHVAAGVADFVGRGKPERRRGLKSSALGLGPARRLAARQMRAKTEEKAPKKHYPAPHALIDLWETHGGDRKAMQKAEIASFAELLSTETAKNLIRVFFLREAMKKSGRGKSGIAHVHVVGAGAMGGEIAAWCAIKGLRVTLGDMEAKPLGKAIAAAAKVCDDRHLSAIEKRDALDRLMPDLAGDGIGRADLVIEAVPEKPDLKAEIYADLRPRMKPDAILASNTSSLDLDALAAKVAKPELFAGLHFFNPVSKMQLVEVVRHQGTGSETLDRLKAFCGEIDRLPAAVANYPGFLVNRALTPYLMEAMVLLDSGTPKEEIDAAAVDFGMPMGPLELADQVGLDICLSVATSLSDRLETPMPEIPSWLREKVEKGELGRKTGKGFYAWKDGRAEKGKRPDEPSAEIADRLILPMLNACVECLRKDVVADTDTADGAMIFGTGFAPFRGGPLHYARARGVDDVVQALQDLEARYGARFKPDEGWRELRPVAQPRPARPSAVL